MAQGKGANGGCVGIFGLFLVIGLIAMIPKGVWIAIGVAVALALLVWAGVKVKESLDRSRAEKAAAAQRAQIAQAAADRQRRVTELGAVSAQVLDGAERSVHRILGSEAARDGWLGEVDFTADLQWMSANFARAHHMRGVADALGALDSPGPADLRLLDETRSAVAALDDAANQRARLIARCADEARLIDESLDRQRAEAKTAQQRAELQGELSGLLYGADGPQVDGVGESAADAVMARVAGFREVQEEIAQARRRA